MKKQKSATARRMIFALSIMKTSIYLPMAAMFLTAALAGPVVAAEKQVPLKGRLEGVVTVTPVAPPFAFMRIQGTGNATHLGLFTIDIPHLVNLQTRTGIGSYAFTAANGDTLTADFTGTGTPTVSPAGLSVVEIAVITGGTGRFADATGSFVVTRSFEFATGLTTGSFTGTISSPGAGEP
jgi:hypothetical protein